MSALKVRCENVRPLARLVVVPLGLEINNVEFHVDWDGRLSASSFGDQLGRSLWKDRATGNEVYHQTVEGWINPDGLHGDEHPAVKALLERYPQIGPLLSGGKL